MAKDIPRNTLRQLVREYKSNGLFKPSVNSKTIDKTTILVKNSTSSLLPVGAFVGLSGFATTLSYSDASSQMLGESLILNGVVANSSLANAVVTESIGVGEVGKARCDNIRFVIVHINDDTHTEISVARETVASSGVYTIIAKSSKDNSNNAVCAVREKTGGSSGISEQITYVSSVTVNSSNHLVFTITQTDVLTPPQ